MITRFDFSQHSVLIENMHDIPYVKSSKFGPEIVAAMTRVAVEVQGVLHQSKSKIPVGIQVLACGGKILSVADLLH